MSTTKLPKAQVGQALHSQPRRSCHIVVSWSKEISDDWLEKNIWKLVTQYSYEFELDITLKDLGMSMTCQMETEDEQGAKFQVEGTHAATCKFEHEPFLLGGKKMTNMARALVMQDKLVHLLAFFHPNILAELISRITLWWTIGDFPNHD